MTWNASFRSMAAMPSHHAPGEQAGELINLLSAAGHKIHLHPIRPARLRDDGGGCSWSNCQLRWRQRWQVSFGTWSHDGFFAHDITHCCCLWRISIRPAEYFGHKPPENFKMLHPEFISYLTNRWRIALVINNMKGAGLWAVPRSSSRGCVSWFMILFSASCRRRWWQTSGLVICTCRVLER